jgi:hypothetical protein
MLYAGLDLSRKRLDFCLLDQAGRTVETGAAPPDADGLRGLAARLARFAEPVLQDGSDRRVGARRACPPRPGAGDLAARPAGARRTRAGTLRAPPRPPPHQPQAARARGPARPRQTLPVSDLFGVAGRALLERLALPEPWAGTVEASLQLTPKARRLHRPLPTRLPIRLLRSARPARQEPSRYLRWAKSPKSTSPADSPKRSGTCSPAGVVSVEPPRGRMPVRAGRTVEAVLPRLQAATRWRSPWPDYNELRLSPL